MYFRILKNLAALKFVGESHVTYPVLASLYLTHRCNLKCTYCSDGCGNPFYSHLPEELSKDHIFQVLHKIVKTTKYLDITGGEPLLRNDIPEIISYARSIGFKGIFVNTNGLLLDKYPMLIEMVDILYFSLDSLDPIKLKNIYRTDEESIGKILNNLQQLLKNSHSTKLYISSVIMSENIADINVLVNFCKENNIGFTASPQIEGISAHKELHNSSEYKACIDNIIAQKKMGLRVIGSVEYYRTIRDFNPYRCFPLLHVAISPEGKVYLPCLELGNKLVNLFEYDSLQHAIDSSLSEINYHPDCGNVCHILCHAGLSLLYKGLSVPISELYYELRDKIIKGNMYEYS